MIEKLFSAIDKPLDYHGQKLAKSNMIYIFAVGYSLSLMAGFILDDLYYTLVLGILTFIAVFLVCIPSWPFYRKNPLKFRSSKAKSD